MTRDELKVKFVGDFLALIKLALKNDEPIVFAQAISDKVDKFVEDIDNCDY
jgi:hypothetical protein